MRLGIDWTRRRNGRGRGNGYDSRRVVMVASESESQAQVSVMSVMLTMVRRLHGVRRCLDLRNLRNSLTGRIRVRNGSGHLC